MTATRELAITCAALVVVGAIVIAAHATMGGIVGMAGLIAGGVCWGMVIGRLSS